MWLNSSGTRVRSRLSLLRDIDKWRGELKMEYIHVLHKALKQLIHPHTVPFLINLFFPRYHNNNTNVLHRYVQRGTETAETRKVLS